MIIAPLAGVGIATRRSLLADVWDEDDPSVVDLPKNLISPGCEQVYEL